jgi:tetratricopeptide (TPR) repeat protein
MNSLTLSMIVRDAGEFLPACLDSVRGLVQEMVIADTGSFDNTVAIAEQSGARVLRIPWNDDFAEARNRALAEVRTDWVLVLDADEQLDATAAARIPPLLANRTAAGYQVPIRNYVLSANERLYDWPPKPNDSLLPCSSVYPAFLEHENVRVFRRNPEIYFVGRVHETVRPRITATRGLLGHADFCIHHFGLALSDAVKLRKNKAYREMGQRKIAELPEDWQAHFDLGLLELEQFKDYVAAESLFSRACDLNPRAGVAWFFLGRTYSRMGYFEDALNALRQASRVGHRSALLDEIRGDVHYNLGQFEEARTSYEATLKRDPANSAARAKVGLATVRCGKAEKGLNLLRSAIAATPAIPELYEGLLLSLVFLGRLREAAEAAQQKLQTVPNPYVGDYIRAASLWAQLNKWSRAARLIERGLQAYPDDPDLNRALGETLAEMGSTPVQVP